MYDIKWIRDNPDAYTNDHVTRTMGADLKGVARAVDLGSHQGAVGGQIEDLAAIAAPTRPIANRGLAIRSTSCSAWL